MTKRSIVMALALAAALGAGFVTGWLVHQPSRNATSVATATTTTSGTVSGHLLAVGGLGGGSRPLPGVIFVSQLSGNIARTRVVVGEDGRYSLSVPAGTYTLTGASNYYNAGRTPCLAKATVSVADGADVVADVLCQEK